MRQWRAANLEKARAISRQSAAKWRDNNPEAAKLSQERYKKAYPEKVRASQKRTQAKNRGRYRIKRQRWAEANRPKTRAAIRAWGQRNKDHIRNQRRENRTTRPEHFREKSRRYRQTPQRKAYARRYRLENRIHLNKLACINVARRRARLANALINDLTAEQWEIIKEIYGHRCVYCGKKSKRLTQDHLTPISHQGSHTFSNVVPACKSCNSKKHAGPVLCPVQPLLLL